MHKWLPFFFKSKVTVQHPHHAQKLEQIQQQLDVITSKAQMHPEFTNMYSPMVENVQKLSQTRFTMHQVFQDALSNISDVFLRTDRMPTHQEILHMHSVLEEAEQNTQRCRNEIQRMQPTHANPTVVQRLSGWMFQTPDVRLRRTMEKEISFIGQRTDGLQALATTYDKLLRAQSVSSLEKL